MPGWHVAVSGLMGAGKSTLVKALARELQGISLEERDAHNPYLAGFYEDPPAWAFKSYVFFLEQTLEDYRRARSDLRGGVQERVLEEHLVVFGHEFHRRGYLADVDLDLLTEVTSTAAALVPPPDLLIHLEIDPAEALRRLRQRALAAEEDVQLDYLESLNARYPSLLADWKSDVLVIDAAAHDFRVDDEVAELAATIGKRLLASRVA
jgi:deoxyadenosine/deoxycytidine kinase